MKPVCIIGAGWYGCHAAACCLEWGIPFIVFEQNPVIFNNASRYNQNRLHQGFHYARSAKTRKLCVDGYKQFMSKYADFTVQVDPNLYIVSDKSLLDGETYDWIMQELDVSYAQVERPDIQHAQLVLSTEERFIDPIKVRCHFQQLLGANVRTNFKITDAYLQQHSQDFSYILNCTNNCFRPTNNCVYELTLSAVFQCNTPSMAPHGFTVVDGSFGSLYPYDVHNNLYTLTHVSHTPLHQAATLDELYAFTPSKAEISKCVDKMVQHISHHVPTFGENYTFHDTFLSFKCKPITSCGERGCYITRTGQHVSVVCGKITGIFQFETYLRTLFDI